MMRRFAGRLPLTMAAVILGLAGCTQTAPKPAPAPLVEPGPTANPPVPALPSSTALSYAGTASGTLSFESSGVPGSRKLIGKVNLSLDMAGKLVSGTYTADFISGRGKKLTITGQLAPAVVSGSAFSGTASVEPPKNTPVKYATATSSHTGAISQDTASISGMISGDGTYTDIAESGTFSIRLNYSAAVAR